MRTETVSFSGPNGKAHTAVLDRPEAPPQACAIFVHCFACSEKSSAPRRIGASLTEVGIAVLHLDVTGIVSDPLGSLDDLEIAANWLAEKGLAPRLLIGHSLGGAAALAAAARIRDIAAVVTINAPADPTHVRGLRGTLAQLDHKAFPVARTLLDQLHQPALLQAVRALRKPLLIFHAPRDLEVPVDDARLLFEAAFHPKSFVSLDDADHLVTDRADANYLAGILHSWAMRYLGAHAAESWPQDFEQAAPDRVTVEEAGPGKLGQRIRAGRHRLVADEPEKLGGADGGPTPYDLLLAGLGACTSMTLRLYADRKGWPLEKVTVDLRHEKIHAEDCKTCETQVGMLDRIERRLHLDGPLDDEQRRRLLEIADRCPVHRTLESEIVIRTEAT